MLKSPGLVPYGIFSIMLQLCDIHWSGKITIVYQYNTYWNGTSTTVYQFKAHRSVMATIVTALWIMRTFTNVEFKNVNATNDDQAATMFRNWFTSLLCLFFVQIIHFRTPLSASDLTVKCDLLKCRKWILPNDVHSWSYLYHSHHLCPLYWKEIGTLYCIYPHSYVHWCANTEFYEHIMYTYMAYMYIYNALFDVLTYWRYKTFLSNENEWKQHIENI